MQESSTEKNVNPEEGADRQGWVVVGTGHEFEGVQVSPPTPTTNVDLGAPVGASGSYTPAQSETLQVESPHGLGRTVSTTSSTTTVSRPSPPPSINIDVSSDPPFEAIAVGDEADYDQQGQQDRRNGRVDEVFKLHSSRRMKPSSAGRGVSIPSREPTRAVRWCYTNHATHREAMVSIYPLAVHTRRSAHIHPIIAGSDPRSLGNSFTAPSDRLEEASSFLGDRWLGRFRSWQSLGLCGSVR